MRTKEDYIWQELLAVVKTAEWIETHDLDESAFKWSSSLGDYVVVRLEGEVDYQAFLYAGDMENPYEKDLGTYRHLAVAKAACHMDYSLEQGSSLYYEDKFYESMPTDEPLCHDAPPGYCSCEPTQEELQM